LRFDGSCCDFEVNVNIDIGRAGMQPLAVRAEQLRYQAAKDHEFGSLTVVMDDSHKSSLGRSACRA